MRFQFLRNELITDGHIRSGSMTVHLALANALELIRWQIWCWNTHDFSLPPAPPALYQPRNMDFQEVRVHRHTILGRHFAC